MTKRFHADSPSVRLLTSLATGALAALFGLLATIAGGLLALNLFRGVWGILFAMTLGGLSAFAFRRLGGLPASSVAGAVGAMVAAYVTIASSETLQPGSAFWAIRGGIYGAMVGVPIGALLGPLGLRSLNRERPIRNDL